MRWRNIEYDCSMEMHDGRFYPCLTSYHIDDIDDISDVAIFRRLRAIWRDQKIYIPFDKFLNGLYPEWVSHG
jgi:hypothetical protein